MFFQRAPKEINDDPALRHFLDEAKEGVIYVSFGSVLKASVMSDDKRKALLSVFGKLKEKVLWKWETDHMEDQPSNVMLHKWLPQQDVLGHPNVKLFVSHGGQSSFQETVCHQKPAVGKKDKIVKRYSKYRLWQTKIFNSVYTLVFGRLFSVHLNDFFIT